MIHLSHRGSLVSVCSVVSCRHVLLKISGETELFTSHLYMPLSSMVTFMTSRVGCVSPLRGISFLNHWKVGGGSPTAPHDSVTFSPRSMLELAAGSSVTLVPLALGPPATKVLVKCQVYIYTILYQNQ